jgi:hypothetical protein
MKAGLPLSVRISMPATRASSTSSPRTNSSSAVTVRGTAGLAARGGGRAASVALADRPCSCRATQSSLGAIDFSSRTGRAACRHSGIGGPRTPGWNCSSPRRGGTVHPPSRPQGWNSSEAAQSRGATETSCRSALDPRPAGPRREGRLGAGLGSSRPAPCEPFG